jgi:methylated-DNA-[protein]-cysteine S-methyltransferase
VTELLIDRVVSGIGALLLVCDGAKLCALGFGDDDDATLRSVRARYGEVVFHDADDPAEITSRLRAYFGGEVTALDAIAVETGGTPFQREVWVALRDIPPGTTISYSELARRIGRPRATRAVGLTNGLNPVAVVVPCHRVIGADASLTGYGGGLHRKRWLLEHEGLRIRNGTKVETADQLAFAGLLSWTAGCRRA